MLIRTTTAALAALAVLTPAAGAAAPPVREPTVAYVDPVAQAIHADGRTVPITPPLTGGIDSVTRGATGWVVKEDGGPLHLVAPDGSHVASPVPTGRGGRPVPESGGVRAALADDGGVSVLRLADGALEARVTARKPRVLAFEAGTVTLAVTRRGERRTATWRPGAQLQVLGRDSRAPRTAERGVVTSTREGYRRLTVVPPSGRGWTVDATDLVAVSPDGRWVATFAHTLEDSDTAPGALSIRRTRTGQEVRRFTVALAPGSSVWEGNRSLVAPAYVRGFSVGLVRFDRDGTQERASAASREDPVFLVDD